MSNTIERSKKGVLVSLGNKEDGRKCLVLDDVTQTDKPQTWRQTCFITLKEINSEEFDQTEFSDEELASFGYYILSRIKAFKNLNEL